MTIINVTGEASLVKLFDGKLTAPAGLGEISVEMVKGVTKPEFKIRGTQKVFIFADEKTTPLQINELLLYCFHQKGVPDFKLIRKHYSNVYQQK